MYTGVLSLTNPRRVPLALTNEFDDTFNMVDQIKGCKSPAEFCDITNKYRNYNSRWTIESDSAENTRLIKKDALGNITYLIAYKEKETLPSKPVRNEIVKAKYTNEIDKYDYSKLLYELEDGQEGVFNFAASNPMPKIDKVVGLTVEELRGVCLGMFYMGLNDFVKIKQ